MQDRSHSHYEVAGREIVAEGTDLRVQVLTLAHGRAYPRYESRVPKTAPGALEFGSSAAPPLSDRKITSVLRVTPSRSISSSKRPTC